MAAIKPQQSTSMMPLEDCPVVNCVQYLAGGNDVILGWSLHAQQVRLALKARTSRARRCAD